MESSLLQIELEKTINDRSVLERLQESTTAKIAALKEREAAIRKLIESSSANGQPDEFEQFFSQLQSRSSGSPKDGSDEPDKLDDADPRASRPPAHTKTFALLSTMLDAGNTGFEIHEILSLIKREGLSHDLDERSIYNIFNKQIHRTERVRRQGAGYVVTPKGESWVKRIRGLRDGGIDQPEALETADTHEVADIHDVVVV